MTPSETVGLREYAGVLLRRRVLFLAVVAAVVVAAVLYTFQQTPVYQATTTLILEPSLPENAGLGETERLSQPKELFQTQYEVIRSNAVLKRAFERCGLDQHSRFKGLKDPIEAFRGLISVRPVRESQLVRLSVDSDDPQAAATWANALAEAYIRHNLEDRRSASRGAFSWLAEQLEVMKAKVEKSEMALLEYKGKEEIVSLERRQALLEEKLSALNDSYNQSAKKSQELRTLLAELATLSGQPGAVESLPPSLESPAVTKLKEELAVAYIELARASNKFKPMHPNVLSLQAEVDGIKQRLQAEVAKIAKTLEVERRISESNERAIKADLDTVKRGSMKLAEQAVAYGVLKRDAESNRELYDVLLHRLKETDISGNFTGNNIRVLDEALVPTEPDRPRKGLNLLLGLALGLLAGIAACFLAEHLDNTLKNEEDVAFYLGETVLGTIPKDRKGVAQEALASEALGHAFSRLKTALSLHRREHLLETLLVTSAVRGEGKTSTVAFLARAFARGGARVLVIDGDMFQAQAAKVLKVKSEVGLSDYFLHGRKPDEVIVATDLPTLFLLPAGLIPPNPAEPIGSERMRELLEVVRGHFDIVLVDSPPLSAALDVAILASLVDGVALVVRAGSTSRVLVRKVRDRLRGARANLVGIILTSAEVGAEDLGAYGYRYETEKSAT